MTKEQLIQQIHEVFPPNVLGDGISWEQSKIIDEHGTAEEERAARRQDAHIGWPQLVDDPAWNPLPGIGGFSFLDAKGFRHYLPAALIRLLQQGEQEIEFHLRLDDSKFHNAQLEKWSELTDLMKGVVARVLQFTGFEEHLTQYWGKYLTA